MAGVSLRYDSETIKKVEDNEFPVYPEGSYRIRIDEAENREFQGKEKIRVKGQIITGPGKTAENAGKSVSQFYDLGPASAWKTKPFLEACGVEFGRDEDGAEAGFDTEDLVGIELIVQFKIKSWEGKDSNEWRNPQPAPAAAKVEEKKAPAAKAAPVTPATPAKGKGAPASKSLD